MKFSLFMVTAALLLFSQNLHAIHRGADDLPYSRKMEYPADQPVNEKYGDKSFFMNLGPTGIRARIDPEAPKAFKVMFVFQDAKSPAKGKINIGDMIVGANGKMFKDAHGFHRKQPGSRGWQGPPFELALAIEDSQGKDGVLELMVQPGGAKSSKTSVSIQLKPVGRFSPTWPWDCPRSATLRTKLVDHMLENNMGRTHGSTQRMLALYASGDKRAVPLFKEMGEKLASQRPQASATGMCTWGWGYLGIFLGEYYNIYKDKAVIPAVEALNICYELGMDYKSGGFSHRPFPAIERRVADGGPKGYGSMAGPGGLSMVAGSIFKHAGLPVADLPYNRTHQAYLAGPGQNTSGTLAYGFGGGWSGTLIRLKDPATPCKNKEGVGYICPTGMDNIGEFVVEKWFQKDGKWDKEMVPPTGEYAWLKSDAKDAMVYVTGHYVDKTIQQRQVIKPNFLPEPTSPFSNDHRGGGHNAPVGMGAVAHYVGNKGNKSWNLLGDHMAIGCAYSPQTLWDGHASGEMHAFWGALGAFRAPEKDLRHFLDYTKTWIILSEPHDGEGLVDQPFGCQRNATCSISLNRTAYSHVALLILSIPNRNLLITGADYAQPSAAVASSSSSSSSSASSGSKSAFGAKKSSFGAMTSRPKKAPLRSARTIAPAKLAALDKSLLNTLVKLSEGKALKPVPLKISKTRAKVALRQVESDGSLTFQIVGGTQTAKFKWDDLQDTDHSTLSLLVAALKSDSTDAQAMAGVYMESVGRVEDADKYFGKAGDESRKKLEKLFD